MSKEQFQSSADGLASIIQKWKEENDLLYEAETSEEENSSEEITTMDMDNLLTDLTQGRINGFCYSFYIYKLKLTQFQW